MANHRFSSAESGKIGSCESREKPAWHGVGSDFQQKTLSAAIHFFKVNYSKIPTAFSFHVCYFDDKP